MPSYQKAEPKLWQMQDATLISNISSIGVLVVKSFSCVVRAQGCGCAAWLLKLPGNDIPHNPVFRLYVFVGLEVVILSGILPRFAFISPGLGEAPLLSC